MKRVAPLLTLIILCASGRGGAQVFLPPSIGSGSAVQPGSLTCPAGAACTIAQYSLNDTINPMAAPYGVKADARSDSTCTITNANPGTISACSTLALTAADNGKLVRVVNNLVAQANLFTGCILNGATGTLGTVVAGVCTSAAYTGLTTTNVFVQVATDDTAAEQSAINALYSTNNTVLRGLRLQQPNRCIMISDTLNVFNKTGEWAGHGMMADGRTATSTPGSCIIWAGPRGHPIVKMEGSFGFWMHDMALFGNSNPSNKPSACIDKLNPPSGFTVQNSVDTISNILCNSFASQDVDVGTISTNPIPTNATYCMLWDPLVDSNNERHYLQHVICNLTDTCFGQLVLQSAAPEINESTCNLSGAAVNAPAGGELTLTRPQFIQTGTKFVIGGGAKVRAYGVNSQTSTLQAAELPQSNIEAEFLAGGAHLNINQSAVDWDANMPPSGVIVDGNGAGVWPVYPTPASTIQQNQFIQPPANYPGWAANWTVLLPNPPAWFANSPYTINYIILPVNNNAGNYYFRVNQPASNGGSGPGYTGNSEPTWGQVVGGTTNDGTIPCTSNACGIQWVNIGTQIMNNVIVPTQGNAGGFAFMLTTGGKTGATQPPAWNQSVGGTTTDNTAVWTNEGVYTTNPNLWVFKETAAGPCTLGASMPVLNQTLNGTTTDGTCIWTTTLNGQNASFVDMTLRDTLLLPVTPNVVNQSPVLLFNPNVSTGTVPTIYFDCDACAPMAAGPVLPFPIALNPVIKSNDGALSTNGWARQIMVKRRSAATESGQNDVERITARGTHPIPDMQHNDFTGKVSVYGQIGVNQVPTPTTGGGTCNVPAWVSAQGIPANWTIKPVVGNNAGNFFFQNQGAACVAGTVQPSPWNQTPGQTSTDGTCIYTNVGDGTGVASSTLAGVYYVKYTQRVGLPNATQGETLPVAERTVGCGPTTSEDAVSVSFTFPPDEGADSIGFYTGLATNTELLTTIVPVGLDTNQNTYRFRVNKQVPPDWAATTVYPQFTTILPTSNNAGTFYYLASKDGVSGAARPGTFNQTIGTLTSDGSQSWLNVGLGAVPAANTTGVLTASGSGLAINGNTSGAVTLKAAAVAGTPTVTLPTVTTTEPAAEPGTSGMALVATTAGVQSYQATEAHLGNAGAYGNNTNFPTGNLVTQLVATNAGHFTQLTSTNQSLNAGSCTTAPTFNVFDGASNTGTAKIASATAQVTKGTATTQAETLTFAAGDVIGIYVSTAGGTCLAPTFAVEATVTFP